MAKTVHSGNLTFIDLTDSKKVDVHLSSNLPTVQIYDVNKSTYSPNWESIPLELTLKAYADSTDITAHLTNDDIKWYRQIGNSTPAKIQDGGTTLRITKNELLDKTIGLSTGIISYICEITYRNNKYENKVTFARVDTGRDGTGVEIKGTATSATLVPDTDYYTIEYSDESITLASEGDAYVYNGDLYVCVGVQNEEDGTDYFINVGRIQGPAGQDAKSIILSGDSQVFKVSTSSVYTPATIKVTAQAINTSVTTWSYSTNGGQTFETDEPTGVVRNENVVTITGSTLPMNSIVIKASDGSIEDVFTVYKAFDGMNGNPGTPASMAFLTNENVTFGANANGQILATSFSTNVVAYSGATKTTPKIGTISGLPTGMTATVGTALNNEMPIVFTIENNATLGSALSNNGSITIPVNGPVYTNLILTWSKVNSGLKGDDGVGIKSVTVTYGTSTSASTQPTSWQSTIPTVAEGSYLWTRTVTDYTEDSIADTVTLTYAKQGAKGDTGSPGTPVTVSSIQYQAGSSATTAPTGTWVNYVVAVAEGNYLWTKTTFSDGQIAYGVAKQGASGRGVSKITEYYLATTASSGVTTSTSGWTPTIQSVTSTNKYLWNYEVITYTDNTTSSTTPVIIGVFGNTGNPGKGIKSVTEYYLATEKSSGVTTSTTGWKDTMQTLTATNKYLWNYELITYTDNTTTTINPVIIGVYGDQGIQGPKGNDAYTVMLTNESHIFAGDVSNAIVGSATTQVLAYNGSTAQTVIIVSVNGKTAATTDTDTGIAGLKFKCSALSGASPTITFTCTTSFVSKSGAIPIVLSVGGVSFTKMFTYSIAFKGTTGNPGSPGTPASLVDITPSALYFKSTTGKDGTFTPDYIYLYPRFQTVAYSKWEYSTNGGSSWTTITSGSNGLTIGTYNSVAYSLQIAKNSALYTDTVTSISFRCVSSNSAVYDTVSIAKIYDVVDLQIGGRNLLKNTNVLISATKDSQTGTQLTFNLVDKYDVSELIGKQLILSYLVSNLGDGVNNGGDTNITGRFGMHGAIFWKNSTSEATTVTYPFTNYLSTKGIDGRISMTATVTPPSGYDTITSISISCQPYAKPASTNDNVWKLGYPKLEIGNKATDWSPATEDLNNITFQIYAPNGYLLTNELPSLTLETFAYEGSIEITSGATFQWSQLIDNVWTAISGATSTSLTVTKADVLRAKSYRCVMTYKSKEYTSTITVQDKTDAYNSIMCMSSNATNGECYWVLYTLVYSDTGEVDPLLGPISISAPTTPVSGDYWYSVDAANATVQLKKYNDTAWVNSTDKQSLTYLWNIVNDGSLKTPIGGNGKVQVISCHDFTATATLVCDVSNEVDGILTQSSLSITDASDPIVSETEPTGIVNGQIWIKPNSNGTYFMSVWDATNNTWISSDMDTRNKVYTSKPASYNKGDIWITESNTAHSSYREGTLLVASADSVTYNASHWSATLKYDKDIGEIEKILYNLSQYVDITTLGLRIGARNSAGELSPFTSLFTSTELAFYQNSEKLLTLANNQLTAPRVVVEEDLEVQGTISLGGLQFTIETNGSFSFAVKT